MAKWIVLLIISSMAATAQGTEIFDDFQNARALGMGNAFSALVDDHNALWYNPAGLDRIRGLHLTILDLGLGTDSATIVQTYQDAVGSNYNQLIRNFFGKQVWVGLSDTAAFSMRDFAIAGYDFFNLSINLNNPAYPNLNFNVTNDVGIIAGTAVSLLPDDVLRLGVAIKRISRYGARLPIGPSTLATLSNSELQAMVNNSGAGYGLDLGMLVELPVAGRPTLSFVWQNVGQTKFTPLSGSAPPPMDNNAIAGFAMNYESALVDVRPAIEYRHINLKEEQIGKRLHLGVEIAFPGFAIRAGANQGYYTAGVGIDLKYFRLEAATYGVELDTYPGQLEDRRYMVQMTLDFNFDPSFSLGGNGSGSDRPSKSFQRR
jgi:hypothetical protein